ncbi:hypothetical protein [Paenibacillus sp. L3-i20]|uniref:XkdQ/YqbQ family protein n=1 Tax=Paenibacillus sp. L3-i20 TaxID=2905833 RepID=UPI001EE02967|nr:hypothetical protein [Paenibacillus sp. L3-i20]GKU79852.1 hypothetical protein L3i20_v242490 [Paenibacillus sp. L3-i20]
MIEMIIDNKNGNVWDVSEIVSSITWKTSRVGRPSSLDFTLIKNALYEEKAFTYNNGDVVRFRYNSANVFYGYIFNSDGGKDEAVKIKCYDQIRYLLNKETYVFANVTASDIVKQIAKDFNLKIGRIEDTIYKIPTMIEDGQTLIDIGTKALDLTLINSGKNYVLFDDFGALTLRNVENLLVDFIIGDGSLMTDYQLKSSIDESTYNRVKLFKDNKESGKREVFITQDSTNIARWGTLQLYQSVDEKMNEAQITQLMDQLIKLHNRESKSLKIPAIGDVRVRAGSYVPIMIAEYAINQPFLVDECTHRFEGVDHTMQVDMKVIS